MAHNFLLLLPLVFSLVILASGVDIPHPCHVELVQDQLRFVVPQGYKVRSGDCSGNDIWSLYRSNTTLTECARLCSSSTKCQAFMFYSNHRCYPKTETCGIINKTNRLNVFYDKVPTGYTMRTGISLGSDIRGLHRSSVTRQERVPDGYALKPGDCSGNDIWGIHGFVPLSECAKRCNNNPSCISFMYHDGRECCPKTRTCAEPSMANPKNMFYDKVPSGYAVRPADCGGNDIWSVYSRSVSLEECARRCNGEPTCISFMFYDGHECYPKFKTCATTSKSNPKNFFYDKIKVI